MTVAASALATLLALVADPGPGELVARLGSGVFAEREEAASDLKKLGREALPALREARSSRDLEIRTRAATLADEIEAASILEPTSVRLDFRDRPLGEVADAIGRGVGVALAPGPEWAMSRKPGDRPAWPDRRITLEAPGPVPFWDAIGRLCRASGLRRDYPAQGHGLDESFRRLTLVPGESSVPASDAGPFRVELLRISRWRDLDLAPGLGNPAAREFNFGGPRAGPDVAEVRVSDSFAELLISVEPRLRIVGQGDLERLEAVDDQGRSVLKEPTPAERAARVQMIRMNPHLDPGLRPESRFVGSGSFRSSPTQFRRVPLADATPPGGRLARLKGVVPVAVMARRADPLVLPLADAKGKTVVQDGIRLTIHEAEVKPGHFHGELELTLETDEPDETLKVQGPGIAPLIVPRPLDLLERQFEILDDGDHALGWSFLQPPKRGVRGRMRLQVRPLEQGERLDFARLRVRVFALVGAAFEVPFSFADVPMP